MVGPIYIIAIALGTAFSLGFFKNANRNISFSLMFLAMAFLTFISGQWLYAFLTQQQETIQIFTAGFKPPFSISLQMGFHEAVFLTMINSLGLLSAIYLFDHLREKGVNMMMVFMLLFMGLNVVVMTRDIFNLFVFLEISSIALVGLIILEKKQDAISSGFKYLIASGVISGILLIGIVATYYYSGSLYINDLISANLSLVKGGSVAVFLIMIAVILELKPFPANGWALDVYQSVNSGIGPIISGGIATAGLFILYKLLPIGGDAWLLPIGITGVISFLGSNFLGIKQKSSNRILAYSSISQVGLLMIIMSLSTSLGDKFEFVFFSVLISQYLAKAGLFWIAGIINKDEIDQWDILKKSPGLVVLVGVFMFTLLGLPPFPAFYGKWELVMNLSQSGNFVWLGLILLGSLFEAIYLLRWFGKILIKQDNLEDLKIKFHKVFPALFVSFAILVFSYLTAKWSGLIGIKYFIPFIIALLIFALDFLPVFIKNIAAIATVSWYSYVLIYQTYIPENDILRIIFGSIFLIGAIIMLIPGFTFKGKRQGFYPIVILMFSGLAGLIEARTTFQFFFAWEIMTLASFLLIIRGKNAIKPSFSYILFSMVGAFVMFAGFGLAFAETGSISLNALADVLLYANWTYVLIAIGFLVKIAAFGVHIWLPSSYAEADDDVTPMISAVLIKSGIFGLIILMLSMSLKNAVSPNIPYILGWVGAIGAIIGNMMAIYQEDVKKLIAYSSIGIMGYILFALSMMSHMGWLTAFTYSIVHFLYKGLLFLAIAGVIYRTQTRNIYEMGGLIKRMPLSFISVLIGIITLAGMPPLAGFAGKWMFYNAVILKGWYLQGAIVFFSGIVAFLYCFKLIHNIFLGPLKDNHRKLKETSIWWLIPQFILIMGIMVISVYPRIVIEPIGEYLSMYFPGEGLVWDGTTAISKLGYWDATKIMMVFGGMFATLFIILFTASRKTQLVEQFNIVFQGERPQRPETTHFAHNMYAPYNKALGFLTAPFITSSWKFVYESIHAISDQVRKFYTGNGQTYALHIILYVVVFYLFINGGF